MGAPELADETLIPPAVDASRLTLCLDLDECLVHYTASESSRQACSFMEESGAESAAEVDCSKRELKVTSHCIHKVHKEDVDDVRPQLRDAVTVAMKSERVWNQTMRKTSRHGAHLPHAQLRRPRMMNPVA